MDNNAKSKVPVSVIILTLNEEINIAACLESLQWADDVIVVDSESKDDTLEIAKATRPSVRISEHPFVDFGDQRNWALDNTQPKNDWILFIDADERVTPECRAGIEAAMGTPGDKVGFYLTCRNHFLGRWIKHCTLYPSWQLRLLKLGHVRYRKEGHGQREVADDPLGYIDEPYDHYGFSKGISNWVERHNRYSTDEVELIRRLREEPVAIGDLFSLDSVKRRRCLKRLAARSGCRPGLDHCAPP